MGGGAQAVGELRLDGILGTLFPSRGGNGLNRDGTTERAMAYVSRVFPGIDPRQVTGNMADYLDAERAEGCRMDCKGPDVCPFGGFRPEVFLEPLPGGRQVVLVRRLKCQAKIEREKQAAVERLLAASRLPERLKSCSFRCFRTSGLEADVAKAKKMAMTALEDGNSLILAGPRGVGKTHLAASMVNSRLESRRQALFVTVPDLLDEFRTATANGRGTELMSAVKESAFLVLDDLGAERPTEWVGERLYMIVNHRYLHRLQTVITTNAGSAVHLVELLGDQGERIVSRLGEMGAWCSIRAKDYRFLRKDSKTGGTEG